MSVFPKIKEFRAFAGGLALLLVGTHLSVMMGFYFFPGGKAFALMQSRLWWELSFSLQILCFALMWVCHHDRVFESKGWKRARAISRLVVGLAGVSTPAWVLVFCAINDWYRHPPQLMDLAFYAGLVFVVWVLMAYVLPVLIALLFRRRDFIYLGLKEKRAGGSLVLAAPFLVLMLVAAIEIPRGSYLHIVVWPFLTYLHGAMPYLVKAYARTEKASTREA